MFKVNEVISGVKPDKFLSLNNGFWHYNFNIIQFVEQVEDLGEITRYKYSYVRISGLPTVDKCYEALLLSYTNEEGTTLRSAIDSPLKTQETVQLAHDIYEQIQIDFGILQPLTELDKAKREKIREIEEYDISAEVNSFYLNGALVWLDKSTRVGLMNSLTIEKSAGKENSTLWFNDIRVVVQCDAAMLMLSALELYALECYNKTAAHKVAVEALTSLEEVEDYDYTIGYPDKLNFTIE